MNMTTTQWPDTISKENRNHILQLIYSNTANDEREKWLSELESATENDTEELIEILSNAHS